MKYKENRKLVEVTCSYCGKKHEKPQSEVKRSLSKERKMYCSRNCCGKANISNLPEKKTWAHLSKYSKSDKFTGFRSFLRSANKRGKEVNITLQDLLDQWNLQQGKCIYSNVDLIKPVSNRPNDRMFTASLDRIDSSLGYIKNNIQFVSIAINNMKGEMTHEQTVEFINLIKQLNEKTR